ncbi:MAG: hypothetical protein ABI473_14170 [Candidatus Dormibacter sp.]
MPGTYGDQDTDRQPGGRHRLGYRQLGPTLCRRGGKNAVYTIKWSGPKGTVFTEAPNDSGVVGFVGTTDMTFGFITPLSTGWTKPTGLIFVPGR